MIKNILLSLILAFFYLFLPSTTNWTQEEELKLRLSKNFGYGTSRQMQGIFTLKASAPESVNRVFFFIDTQTIGEDNETPFQIQFSTDDYPLGMHDLSATGYTAGGQEIKSNVIQMEFVSANAGWQAGTRLLGPVLIFVVGIVGLAVLATVLSSNKRRNPAPGTQRKYGFSGGSICPKCGRPTPLHISGLNLGLSKFDRCENCGKWSSMRPRPLIELRQAEVDELARAKMEESASAASLSDADQKLRKDLEDSRYLD